MNNSLNTNFKVDSSCYHYKYFFSKMNEAIDNFILIINNEFGYKPQKPFKKRKEYGDLVC